MPERRLKPSNPNYAVLNKLQQDLVIAINPQLFSDVDLPEVERQAIIAEIKILIETEISLGAFADFLDTLE